MNFLPSLRRWALWFVTAPLAGLAADAYDEPPFHYSTAAGDDPVAALAQAVEAGQRQLPGEGTDRELAAALCRELDISPESQALVFSKTSLQRDKITPANPRAIYFNDETYVGWVPGGLMELTGMHPRLGAYFYSMDPESAARPRRITRHANCLDCHAGGMTGHWPGLMIRSLHTDERGFPLLQAGSKVVDHTTPIADRWGGWYVTGQHGSLRHMGNVIAKEKGDRVTMDREPGANLASLDGLGILAPGEYLARGSDIVALMVLEHQILVQNRLTAASYEVASAIERLQLLRKELGEPAGEALSGSAKSVAESHTEKILEPLLFCGEAPLPDGGIEGSIAFQDAYRAKRVKCSDGRSLKDFQLLNRLFKHRCSSQIYNRQWHALPAPLRTMLYTRLDKILQAPADRPETGYEHLGFPERQAIREILLETHPEAAAAWRQAR